MSHNHHQTGLPTLGFTFHYLRLIRWLPLGLFAGIALADSLLQYQHELNTNWLFVGICLLAGILLFQLGNILCYQEYRNQQLYRQRKGQSQTGKQTQIAAETPCRNFACAYRSFNRAARLMLVGAVVEAAFTEKRRELGETAFQCSKIQPRQTKVTHTRRINQRAA